MLLTQEENASIYMIKEVVLDAVTVNDDMYTQSLIIMPKKIITPWRPRTLHDVMLHDFDSVLDENIEIILLGVGSQGGRLSPEIYANVLAKKVAIECMSLAAAARTYSILSAENRAVAAAMVL